MPSSQKETSDTIQVTRKWTSEMDFKIVSVVLNAKDGNAAEDTSQWILLKLVALWSISLALSLRLPEITDRKFL